MWKGCEHPKMPTTGEGRAGVFLLAEAPGEAEDRKGVQLVGRSGQLLRKELKALGIDLDRDCWKMNAVNCRPVDDDGQNRTPTDSEIEQCRPKVFQEIHRLKPKVIVLLGGVAVKSFLAHRWQKNLGGIQKWRGWAIPDRDVQAWVVPCFHPSFVLRSEKQPVVGTIFRQDLGKIPEHVEKPFPTFDDGDGSIEILEGQAVVRYLEEVLRLKPMLLAFDYETTGLKPHARGHRIAVVSMCWQNNRAVAWRWSDTPIPLFRKVLEDERIGKVASNLKMEDHWTAVRVPRTTVKGWVWDTMLAAHTLDNRKGITSLKFDVYKRYGVVDYASHLDPYLQSSTKGEEGSNGKNRIEEAPLGDLLVYGARDSLYEYWLAQDQMRELGVIK
jgi:uracil-DNA glycosylase family 4